MVKERLLFIIKVREYGQVPFRVVKEMNRSNPSDSYWLKIYGKEGTQGLNDRPKAAEDQSYQKRRVIK